MFFFFQNFSRMIFIVAIVMEKNVFAMFGLRTPGFWTWCMNNKIYACLSIFFFSNMVENMMVSSGAFEISMNGNSNFILK